LNFGGCASGVGSLPGNGGCGVTPRFGIGSAAVGVVTRVGVGTFGVGVIDGVGRVRPIDADAGTDGCGEGCTWFGLRTMPSSATLRTGAMFLGGGAVACNSATLVLTGNATFITGSRKRGPGTIVAPS
jgi:hypothetical protein